MGIRFDRSTSGAECMEGVLTDETWGATCNSTWQGFMCTLETHAAKYPHLAGGSDIVYAIWWESEADTPGVDRSFPNE